MRKPIDVDELKKIFRIRDGNLERINLRKKDGTWKLIKLYANHTEGYCQVRFNDRMVRHHVIIWILSMNKNIPIGYEIDHINGNRIDNRIENLRLVTNRGNSQNMKKHRDGQLIGAIYDKYYDKWKSQIYINKNRIHIGRFTTEKEASQAYEIACKYIESYVDNKSFRELIKKEIEKEKLQKIYKEKK